MDLEQVKTKVLFCTCSTIKYINCVETSQQSI